MLLWMACSLATGAIFCNFTLHVPRKKGAEPTGAVPAKVLASDNVTLQAWWFPFPGGSRNCVLVLHGIGDARSSSSGFASMFLHHGYSVLAPDSRAHGDSGGEVVTYGLIERYDVISWAHWLQGRGCSRIYGLGESLGASILLQAISVEPIFRAIVAECPYARLRQMAEYRVGQKVPIPRFLSRPLSMWIVEAGFDYALLFDKLNFRNVSPETSLRESVTPVLLIHGLVDDRTPWQQSMQLARARPLHTQLWLVPGASHTNASTVAPREFESRVFSWFSTF